MGRTRRISEDEFGETLSLIDLPITPIRRSSDHHHHQSKSSTGRFPVKQEDVMRNRACSNSNSGDDFKFGSFTGSPSTRSEMSTADELFLHGRILPLRLSVDSKMTHGSNPVRPECGGSDSMSQGRSSSVGFTSTSNSSSRSSSYSSTSSRSANNAARTTTYTPKIRNQFHAHPSPTPQIRVQQKNLHRYRKSSVWDIFRLGPVHAPEIELKDLKHRKPIDRKPHSFISKNNDLNDPIKVNKKETLKQMLAFGGCRCSVDDVESRIVVIKSSNKNNYGDEARRRRSDFHGGEITEELRRKLEEMRRMKNQGPETEEPSRRTFEWLKQLSIEGQNHDGEDNLNME